MEELRLEIIESTDITGWDFEALKEQLNEQLDYYRGIAYTEDTIKDAKDDKSKLAKAKKTLEDARKAYKNKCLEPYAAVEPRIKELTDMIEEQRVKIDGAVKEYEQNQKEQKERVVREYYNKKSFVLGEYADPLFDKIKDPRWFNATTKRASYEQDVQIAINNALNDINEIKSWASPYEKNLLGAYASALTLEQVRDKNEEFLNANKQAGISQQSLAQAVTDTKEITKDDSSQVGNFEGDITLRFHFANKIQSNRLFDYLDAVGIKYEIQ